jgi:hypothetical protein
MHGERRIDDRARHRIDFFGNSIHSAPDTVPLGVLVVNVFKASMR